MRIIPVQRNLEDLYRQSRVLSRPLGELTLDAFTNRIRRFNRDAVICGYGQFLWRIYREPQLVEEARDTSRFDVEIIESYGPTLIAIACLCCSDYRADLDSTDLRILPWELMSVPDPALQPEERDSVLGEIEAAILSLPPGHPLRGIPAGERGGIISYFFRGRLGRRIASYRMVGAQNVLNNWAIYRRLVDKLGPGEARVIETTTLGMPALQFFRAGFGLLALAGQDQITASGFINLSNTNVDDEVQQTWGITGDDLRLVATRLSRSASSIRDARAVNFVPSRGSALYSPVLDFLAETPIIELDEYSNTRSGKLVVPSPRSMMSALSSYATNVAFRPQTLPASLSWPRLASLRGMAFHEFIGSALPDRPNLIDADGLEIADYSGKRPDYLWVGERNLICIELKYDVRPNNDPGLLRAWSFVKSWDEPAQAIAQAADFVASPRVTEVLRNRGVDLSRRQLTLLLCTNDEFTGESTCFVLGAKKWQFLSATPLVGFNFVSASDFIEAVNFLDADIVGDQIVELWNNLDPNHPASDPVLRLSDPEYARRDDFWDQSIAEELFPSVNARLPD